MYLGLLLEKVPFDFLIFLAYAILAMNIDSVKVVLTQYLVLFHHLFNLFVRHVCDGCPRWRRGSPHLSALCLALLPSIWLTLRSCWYDVSFECRDARRYRRMSERLTLNLRLLQGSRERRLSWRASWLLLAWFVDLSQGVSTTILGRRCHIILPLLRWRRARRLCVGWLRWLALLCVVSLLGLSLEG